MNLRAWRTCVVTALAVLVLAVVWGALAWALWEGLHGR